MEDFKLCKTCKTPSACKSAGKCMGGKSGYNMGGMTSKNKKTTMGYAKGGMVKSNCGASMKPNGKSKK